MKWQGIPKWLAVAVFLLIGTLFSGAQGIKIDDLTYTNASPEGAAMIVNQPFVGRLTNDTFKTAVSNLFTGRAILSAAKVVATNQLLALGTGTNSASNLQITNFFQMFNVLTQSYAGFDAQGKLTNFPAPAGSFNPTTGVLPVKGAGVWNDSFFSDDTNLLQGLLTSTDPGQYSLLYYTNALNSHFSYTGLSPFGAIMATTGNQLDLGIASRTLTFSSTSFVPRTDNVVELGLTNQSWSGLWISDAEYTDNGTNLLRNGIAVGGGVTGLANPSGLIGLTAVNGVATTADRSDSTHALDQSIAPTWTGTHQFNNPIQIGSPTNFLERSGSDLVYTNSANSVRFTLQGGTGSGSIQITTGGQMMILPASGEALLLSANGNGSGLWTVQSGGMAPTTDKTQDLGSGSSEVRDGYIGRHIVWNGTTNSVFDLTGSGSPETVVTASVGSVYRRYDGGSATTLYVKESGAGNTGWIGYGPGSAGTVTSVALASPAEFTVSGSPVTTSGTLTFAKANQNANLIYAGPSSGGAAAPTFRAAVAADLPGSGASTITDGAGIGAGATLTVGSAYTVSVSANIPQFSGLYVGGKTASFPMITNSGAVLKARLADNSGDASFTSGRITESDRILATGSIAWWQKNNNTSDTSFYDDGTTGDVFSGTTNTRQIERTLGLTRWGTSAASPQAETFSFPNASGTDHAGATWSLNASQSTGVGKGGAIEISTSPTLQSSGSTPNSLAKRLHIEPHGVALTGGSATLVFNVSLASGKTAGLHVFATTIVTDGTDRQSSVDDFTVTAINKAGTVTTSALSTSLNTTASSSGTITTVWTAVANGNGVDVKNNQTSTVITPTSRTCYWRAEVDTDDTGLAFTVQ